MKASAHASASLDQLLKLLSSERIDLAENVLWSFIDLCELFIKLTPQQTRYHVEERENMAVVECLAECRWLVKGPRPPNDHLYRPFSAAWVSEG